MTNKKNILFISYDGLTDPLGQSQVIPYLAGLTRFGYRFTILSCEKPERFKSGKKYVEKMLQPFEIKWAYIRYHKNPAVFSSVYDVLMLNRKAKQLHLKENFDMVHTRAGIPALTGLLLKKQFGIKFLHDIREFYADGRIDGGMWNKENFFYRRIYSFFKKKEEEQVKNADGIVCLTHSAKDIIKKWAYYKSSVPLEVIPCSVDMNLFDPVKINLQDQQAVKRDLKINEQDFIVTYLGSVGGWYLTDEMMQMYKELSEKIHSIKFLFITPHPANIIIQAAAKHFIATDQIVVAHAKRHEVPLYLSLSNYSIFFIKPCYSKLSSSPTKHGEIMAMGIPLITNAGVGDVDEIVNETNSGIVLKELNGASFKAAANKIRESLSSNKEQTAKAAIVAGANRYYSLDEAVEKYRKMYTAILL
ncbi:MAG: glycosyltransferase [Ginsengibacter sp.]